MSCYIQQRYNMHHVPQNKRTIFTTKQQQRIHPLQAKYGRIQQFGEHGHTSINIHNLDKFIVSTRRQSYTVWSITHSRDGRFMDFKFSFKRHFSYVPHINFTFFGTNSQMFIFPIKYIINYANKIFI